MGSYTLLAFPHRVAFTAWRRGVSVVPPTLIVDATHVLLWTKDYGHKKKTTVM